MWYFDRLENIQECFHNLHCTFFTYKKNNSNNKNIYNHMIIVIGYLKILNKEQLSGKANYSIAS